MSSAPAEDGRAVRDEDAIDVAAVAAWLRRRAAEGDDQHGLLAGVDLGTDEAPVLPEVRQFAGGASNLTYLLRYPGVDLVLRRPPAGVSGRGAHDMRREYDVQAALRPVFPGVPRLVGFCDDPDVLGSDFYVMERLAGPILRREIPPELGLDVLRTRLLCERAVDTLADLHSVDLNATGLRALDRGDGYVRRQVEGWSRRYDKARTPDVPDYRPVMRWLAEHRPPDRRHGLIHNDYRFDNLVLDPEDPTRIVGVLDWEMATVGDPLMDLGGALAYWVEARDGRLFRRFRRQPTHAFGMLTRAEVVDRYSQRTGLHVSPEQWLFYEVFGLFRLAVIAQQIHNRYFHGVTTNPAFRTFRPAVLVLEQRCLRLMREGTERGAPGFASRHRRGAALALARRAGHTVVDGTRLVRPLAYGVGHAVRSRNGGGRS